ncbi:hypothetical protein DY000_02054761 [Brassica cretica]|uniref:Uncharacterized protein n=1 Tax=Brassica cretica TaxID=69181 RepID=A0ABQ7A487_BRACR|nr:hypothetical protein DY000_02054761 [Brassica cretica]
MQQGLEVARQNRVYNRVRSEVMQRGLDVAPRLEDSDDDSARGEAAGHESRALKSKNIIEVGAGYGSEVPKSLHNCQAMLQLIYTRAGMAAGCARRTESWSTRDVPERGDAARSGGRSRGLKLAPPLEELSMVSERGIAGRSGTRASNPTKKWKPKLARGDGSEVPKSLHECPGMIS